MIAHPMAYIVCSTADMGAVKAVLGDILQLPADPAADAAGAVGFLCGTVRLLFLPRGDDRLERPGETGVDHLGLAVPATGLPTTASATLITGLFTPRASRLDPAATAGVSVRAEEITACDPVRSDLVERLDHVGVASADNEDGIAAFCDRLGFPLESNQYDVEFRMALETFTSDRYGIVQHARPAERIGGLRVTFVTVADCELEFLQDLDPGTATAGETSVAGTTKRDQSAISRFLARRGPGLHHLAFKTPDIDDALARLDGGGVPLIDRTGRPGSRRARIGFLHPRALGGVLAHFVEREQSA